MSYLLAASKAESQFQNGEHKCNKIVIARLIPLLKLIDFSVISTVLRMPHRNMLFRPWEMHFGLKCRGTASKWPSSLRGTSELISPSTPSRPLELLMGKWMRPLPVVTVLSSLQIEHSRPFSMGRKKSSLLHSFISWPFSFDIWCQILSFTSWPVEPRSPNELFRFYTSNSSSLFFIKDPTLLNLVLDLE